MFKNLLFRALEISLGWLLGQLEKKWNNPKRYAEEQAAHLATQNEEADTTETENSERSADASQTQEEEETGDDEEGEAECPTPPLPQEQQERKPTSHLIGLHQRLLAHLQQHYDLRFNVLTEEAEFRPRDSNESFRTIDPPAFNTLTIGVIDEGIGAWSIDVGRLLHSSLIPSVHPIREYLAHLPTWDGRDHVGELALRVSDKEVWTSGLRIWLRALTLQWMGEEQATGNALVPLLVSREQGMRKSTFVRLLMPPELMPYFTDKFDLSSSAGIEQRMARLGLISLDEFDRYTPRQTAILKNLLQLKQVNLRRSYRQQLMALPRLASFIATSNERELLTDLTGSRRFLCIEVTAPMDCSPIEHAQLFAQLRAEVLAGERTYLTHSEEERLQQHNRSFMVRTPAMEVFWKAFRRAKSDEAVEPLTATEIFITLQRTFPTALRGLTPSGFGRQLRGLGLRCSHSKHGNCYRVVECKESE